MAEEPVCTYCGCPVDDTHPGFRYSMSWMHSCGTFGCINALRDRLADLERQVDEHRSPVHHHSSGDPAGYGGG